MRDATHDNLESGAIKAADIVLGNWTRSLSHPVTDFGNRLSKPASSAVVPGYRISHWTLVLISMLFTRCLLFPRRSDPQKTNKRWGQLARNPYGYRVCGGIAIPYTKESLIIFNSGFPKICQSTRFPPVNTMIENINSLPIFKSVPIL